MTETQKYILGLGMVVLLGMAAGMYVSYHWQGNIQRAQAAERSK